MCPNQCNWNRCRKDHAQGDPGCGSWAGRDLSVLYSWWPLRAAGRRTETGQKAQLHSRPILRILQPLWWNMWDLRRVRSPTFSGSFRRSLRFKCLSETGICSATRAVYLTSNTFCQISKVEPELNYSTWNFPLELWPAQFWEHIDLVCSDKTHNVSMPQFILSYAVRWETKSYYNQLGSRSHWQATWWGKKKKVKFNNF